MWHDETYQHHEFGGEFDAELQCTSAENIDGLRFRFDKSSGNSAKQDEEWEELTSDPGLRFLSKRCCGEYPYKHEYFVNRKSCCNGRIENKGSC